MQSLDKKTDIVQSLFREIVKMDIPSCEQLDQLDAAAILINSKLEVVFCNPDAKSLLMGKWFCFPSEITCNPTFDLHDHDEPDASLANFFEIESIFEIQSALANQKFSEELSIPIHLCEQPEINTVANITKVAHQNDSYMMILQSLPNQNSTKGLSKNREALQASH